MHGRHDDPSEYWLIGAARHVVDPDESVLGGVEVPPVHACPGFLPTHHDGQGDIVAALHRRGPNLLLFVDHGLHLQWGRRRVRFGRGAVLCVC